LVTGFTKQKTSAAEKHAIAMGLTYDWYKLYYVTETSGSNPIQFFDRVPKPAKPMRKSRPVSPSDFVESSNDDDDDDDTNAPPPQKKPRVSSRHSKN
jgi:hypothetical protein